MYNISKVADEQANVGEGPLWDDEAQVLYWADIRSGRLFKFNPSTGENKTIEKTVILKTKKQEFIFRNVRSNLQIPLVTYFREISSPVEWESDTTLDEKF